jgi:hypothetical protein
MCLELFEQDVFFQLVQQYSGHVSLWLPFDEVCVTASIRSPAALIFCDSFNAKPEAA